MRLLIELGRRPPQDRTDSRHHFLRPDPVHAVVVRAVLARARIARGNIRHKHPVALTHRAPPFRAAGDDRTEDADCRGADSRSQMERPGTVRHHERRALEQSGKLAERRPSRQAVRSPAPRLGHRCDELRLVLASCHGDLHSGAAREMPDELPVVLGGPIPCRSSAPGMDDDEKIISDRPACCLATRPSPVLLTEHDTREMGRLIGSKRAGKLKAVF